MTLLLVMAGMLPVAGAMAAVIPQEVTPPTNLGVEMKADLAVRWDTVPVSSGGTFTLKLPAEVTVEPADALAAGCTAPVLGTLTCTIPTGVIDGTLRVQVKGVQSAQSLSFVATGDDTEKTSASNNTGSVTPSGDLTVTKLRTLPVGNVVASGKMSFELKPRIGGLNADIPTGASIKVVDRLPGGVGQFEATSAAVSAGPATSCVIDKPAHTVTCTYTGPLLASSFANASIVVEGVQKAEGRFDNNVEIVPVSGYLDRVVDANNKDSVDYTAGPGTDIQALASLSAGPHLPESNATLTLTYKNNGPVTSTNGSIEALIPDGFVIDNANLPPGCSLASNVPSPGQTLTCQVNGTLAAGSDKPFAIPVKMPPTPGTGSIAVKVNPDPSLADGDPTNNTTSVNYTVDTPLADLNLKKEKLNSTGAAITGPQIPGTQITTKLTFTNAATSTGTLSYSPTAPLVVLDFMRPEEIDADLLSNVSNGWACSVRTATTAKELVARPSTGHTKIVECKNPGPGTLAIGQALSMSFTTTIAPMATNAPPVTINDKACASTTAMDILGTPSSGRPYPEDQNAGNDCREAGTNLVATPVGKVTDSGKIDIVKQVSKDNSSWSENVVLGNLETDLYWKIEITRPTGSDVLPIQTLDLVDDLPGISSLQHALTPAINVTIDPSSNGYNASASTCPTSIQAGKKNLTCKFSDVVAGAKIILTLHVKRELGDADATWSAASGSGHWVLNNKARISSPNAVLSGTVEDGATAEIAPRLDVRITNKIVNPGSPAIGQPITFSISAENRGPFAITGVGDFVVVDDIYTGEATLAQPSYDLSAGPAAVTAGTDPRLTCELLPGVPDVNHTRVRCSNNKTIPANNTALVKINTQVMRPALTPSTYPLGSVVYDTSKAINTASVQLGAGICEWNSEIYSAGGVSHPVSTACGDASALGNNASTLKFQITTPDYDLVQAKEAIFPVGRTDRIFYLNEELRFRFTISNGGLTRAEAVKMTDFLDPQAGYDLQLVSTTGENMNAGTVLSGHSKVARAVSCSQPAADKVSCTFTDKDYLGPKEQLDFELRFKLVDKSGTTNTATTRVSFGDTAMVCSSGSQEDATTPNGYEHKGWCTKVVHEDNNNNARINGSVWPRGDLTVSKTTDLPPGSKIDTGDVVPFTITLTNNGPDTVARLRMVDTLPNGFEWVTTSGHTPLATVKGAASITSALAISSSVPTAGTGNVCYLSGSSTNPITDGSQHQQITCDLLGNFPNGAANGVEVKLWARPVPGVYSGPYATPVKNKVKVSPGRDENDAEAFKEPDTTNNDAESDVEVKQAASIGGRVFADANDNGDQDPGDAAIAGVELTLIGVDANGNTIALTTLTNSSGDYLFQNLPPSDASGYTITQKQPSGYPVNGVAQPNTVRSIRNGSSIGVTSKGTASNPDNATSVISGVVLSSGGTGVMFDFPEPNERQLSGFVYIDQDNSLTFNAGDAPIAGATLTLLEVETGRVLPPVTTTNTGAYTFTGLSAGKTYVVSEPLPGSPAGLVDVPAAVNPGKIGGTLCARTVCIPGAGTATDESQISGIKLLAGDGTEFNFGENLKAPISGVVFLDRKATAGDFDGGSNDVGIADVDIAIKVKENDAWVTVYTGKTDGNGAYSYLDAVVGKEYLIEEVVQPAGLGQSVTNPGNSITIAKLPVAGQGDNNFGEKAAVLSGVVYLDSNNNGVQDGTEPGLANVVISLPAAVKNALGADQLTAITDQNGNYSFPDLLAGTYTVTQQSEQPVYGGATTHNGKTTEGSTGGRPTPVSTVPSAISDIPLTAGGSSVLNNFGEILVAAISGSVYVDRNDNGSFDAADAGNVNSAPNGGIVGVVVVLYEADGTTEITRTTTDRQGGYSFSNLPTGVGYVVKELQPTGYAEGKQNSSNSISIGTLPVAGVTGQNFGELLGSLAGLVYEDFSGTASNNNNGRHDSGEKIIGGVTLRLTGTDANGDPVDRVATTDTSTGAYSFGDLLAGSYVITETQPTAYIDGKHTVGTIGGRAQGSNAVANVISGITLAAGQSGIDYLFGELANAPISGTIYIDRNSDGKQDAGEPGIPNISLTVEVEDGPGNWVKVPGPAIVTDNNGHYTYPDAVTGKNYRVTETQPTGLADGKENGTVNTGTANVIVINNLPSTGSSGNNFGEIAAVLSGAVYLDSNNDGIKDAGEPGLPNVEVTLPAGTKDALGKLIAKVVTDADGNYMFQDLLEGTYTVTQQLAQPLYGGATTHNGKTTQGSTGGTASLVTETPSAIKGIPLLPGESSVDNNFGEVLVASISGTVYVDRNDSGSFDGADAGSHNSAANGGIVGVEVVLYEADGVTEVARIVTDAQGNYAFTDLPVGVAYVIKETQPVGYAEGKENTSNSITTAVLPTAGVSGQNFGETLAALAGVVYEDFSSNATGNNNGNQDSGEAGIAGVTLTLSGTDAAGNPVNRTATTDASGAYNFGDLLAGTYTVTETQPTGYEDGKHKAGNATVAGSNAVANILSDIGLDAGQQASGYLFGELKKAPISGTVYVDRNDNGDQDGSEPGIPGVTITITSNGPDGVPGGGDDVSVTITTDSDGNYSWPDALPGVDYTITETQPSDLADGKENGSNTITITNLPSTGVQDNNFGEKAAVLSGVVYLDSNNNGVRDAGEPGLANVEVALPASVKNVLGVAALTATTDNDGNYVFQDLLAGTYTVTEQAAQPSYNGAATINGITTVGTTGGAVTSVTTVPSAISGIRLAAGGKSEQNNFGEVLQVSIAGTVFLDVNNDGAHAGAGENGLADVVIELTGVDDVGATVALSTTTDKDGKFSFEGLRPGKYSLTEPTQPTGTANGITTAGTVGGTATGVATPVTTVPSVIADIDLSTPGSASVDNLFGEIPRSSGISGKVWEDSNNDGVVDPGEKGLGGVTVELEGTAIDGTPIKVTVTTDPDGNYSFTELPPGTYTVIEPNQPPGTLDGKTVPGSTGGTPTAPGTPASKISTIKVGVNETSSDNNFGEIPVGSIAGYVYNDSNDDGIKQGDETGYAVIDVVLTGTDDLGNAVNASAKTDTQGHYVFENLRPGTYTVTEPTQPAETLNGLTTAGTIDGVKSTAKVTGKDTVPSAIDGIVLKPGNNAIDNNFGEIGDSPDMLVSKSSSTVKFTVNNVATYTIRVRNGGQKASFGEYLVKDRLPAGLTLAEVPAGNGWNCSGAVGDGRFECRSSEVVAAGTTSLSDITVKVNVLEEAAKAGTVNNAVLIEGGGENEFRTPTTTERGTFEGNVTDLPVCDAAITQNVCRVQNEVQLAASVGGTVWFDIGSDDALLDGGDERLQSWVVELVDPATGAVSKTATTAVDGSYRFADVIPGQTWNIQFRDPASGVLWAWPVNKETAGGMGVSCDADKAISGGGASACRISENGASQLQVVLPPGAHLPQQSLPVDPSGVVYDATTRDPVPGSIVTLSPVGVCNGYDPLTAVLNAAAGGYRVEGNAISMTVGNNGYYQFMFGPAAPARCEFRLTVTPPGGYQFVSSMIPPQDGSLSPAGAAGSNHLVQPQATAPTGAVGTPTQYWLTLFSGSATAGIIHNHIPLDTAEATGLVITKTGDRQTAEIGDTVQYTITVRQTAGSALATVNIVDTLPRGFTYIDGTGRVGGRAVEDPLGKPGPRLGFNLGSLDVGGQLVLTYRVRVGVGAQQGDGVNRAQAHGCSIAGGCIDPVSLTPVPGSIPSNRAEYRVRVTGGVFTEEACVLGKVFVDCNNNHVQDEEELGIPGVRMYFSNGTWMVSDSEGKYSYCGLTPQSHTLKVDPSTLPVGARLTTSSNRNLGDADSLFLDLKNGELHRADFVEGSCSNPLLEQVKARRTQGEVRAPETETGQSQLRFDSKPARAPQQATDSSKQGPIVQPRPNPPSAAAQQEVQP
ncbi:SdrD B-like domain-containing protein [Stenotrophomonas sp.]|uniref:SdrD B-like domain-containing protein n=1 Tax=Stenotrophomonas sp. TaxID=69392 RepID=UPI0028A7C336|nr:SdrD B-like domain-containing protein [Stenotrophomonas sp.]